MTVTRTVSPDGQYLTVENDDPFRDIETAAKTCGVPVATVRELIHSRAVRFKVVRKFEERDLVEHYIVSLRDVEARRDLAAFLARLKTAA